MPLETLTPKTHRVLLASELVQVSTCGGSGFRQAHSRGTRRSAYPSDVIISRRRLHRRARMNPTLNLCAPCLVHPIPKCGLRRFIAGCLVVLTIAFTQLIVDARGEYPKPADRYVHDYAGLLTSDDATKIRTIFTNLKQHTGIEAVVVTINS